MKGIDTMLATQFKTLDVKLTKKEYQLARMYADIQTLCSNFLTKNCSQYKNSINFINAEVDHDYYIRHIAVEVFKKSMLNSVEVETWENCFDIVKIVNILHNKSTVQKDVDYVRSYFCNKYHIKIKSGASEIVCDVRTALTKLEPKPNWNFLFAIDKVNMRKNNTALLYCIGNKSYIHKIVFSGIVLYNTIKQCPILKKGQATAFGTINRIDNYVTTLNKDYIY